jgi:hypothetical protein
VAFPFKTTRAHAPQQFVGLSGSPLAAGLVYAAGGDFRFNQADGDNGGLRVGGLVVTTPRGPALKLNGAEYVKLGVDVAGVDLFADSSHTWSIVALVRQNAAGSTGSIVAKTSGESGATTHLNMYLESGGVSTNIRGSYASGGGSLSTNPNQITLTWDGTTAYLHRDETITGTRTVGTASAEAAETICFGARNDGASLFLTGELGYVLIYNRAISRAEHLALLKSPGSVFASNQPRFWLPSISGGGVSGTASVVDGPDTATAAGKAGTVGAAAVTEAGDAAEASGKVGTTGAAAATEAADIAAATGSVGTDGVTGSASVVEAGDSAAAAGTVGKKGSAAVTDSGDVPAGVGKKTHTGTASVTESGDVVAAVGTVPGVMTLTPADIEAVAAAVVGRLLGSRTLGAHLQVISATLVGESSGAGTAHMAFTDGGVTVEADVPLPGVVGDRTNIVISGV